MISKIISGGQVGADIAALRAAISYGIPTGGWMPKGWRTKAGPMPLYKEIFRLQEMDTGYYRDRTFRNVMEADGTVRIAYNFSSPGERCTLNAIQTYLKPAMDVPLVVSYSALSDVVYIRDREAVVQLVVGWIQDKKIKVLNVAGNADKMIEPIVEQFMGEVIKLDTRSSTR